MTATLTLDEILSWFDCRTLTTSELSTAPHDLDPTCNRATLETGETYRWDKRRGLWTLQDGSGTTGRLALSE
jgi:hypothetical protein